MINRKFLYFKTLAGFEAALIDRGDDRTGIRQDSIVFIGQEKLIWNRGVFYGKDEHKDERSKGLFQSENQLLQTVPLPVKGDWAFVKVGERYYIYLCEINGVWVNSGDEYHMGISEEELRRMFKWYTEDFDDIIEGIQKSIADVDTKYEDEIKDIRNILKGIGNSPELPSGIITEENISQYIPQNIITEGNLWNYITIDTELSGSSANPVQNSAIWWELQKKVDAPEEGSFATQSQFEELSEAVAGKALLSDFQDLQQDVTDLSDAVSLKYNTTDAQETYRDILDRISKKVDTTTYQAHCQYAETTYAKNANIEGMVQQYVSNIAYLLERSKGYFDSELELSETVPYPIVGDWAIVNINGEWIIYRCAVEGEWQSTGQIYRPIVDLRNYVKQEALSAYSTKEDLRRHENDAKSTYLTQDDLADYALKTDIPKNTGIDETVLRNYVTRTDHNTHVAYAENTYAKKSQVNGFVSKTYVDEKDDTIMDVITKLQASVRYIYNTYVKWSEANGQDPRPDDPYNPIGYNRMVTLREEEYQGLVAANAVDPNTYYFTYEVDIPENTSWHFGDTFPIILTGNTTNNTDTWKFGDEFPITFLDNWEFGDKFPITFLNDWEFGKTFPIKLT